MLSELNKIVSYWYNCIKNEDILEKDISINVRSKAVLYPFDFDPFIFDRQDNLILISENERLTNFFEYISVKDYEPYYGYPILFFYDDKRAKFSISPLFIIKVRFLKKKKLLYLQKDDLNPTCGINAFGRLGFRNEEIADINNVLSKLFLSDFSSSIDLANKCMNIIQQEAEIHFNEGINPSMLTNSTKITKNSSPGMYNKSMIFADENTDFNIYLLQDLLELKEKMDLDKTAISFIVNKFSSSDETEKFPILPFPANEYQINSIQNIFKNKLSVITGPPGTGKSQYISNLLVNLFFHGKSVLFVSHTNEAVNVVNEKINDQFKNIMFRTGNKEFRQDLKGRFNELMLASKMSKSTIGLDQIQSLWEMIIKYRDELVEIDNMERLFENSYKVYIDRKFIFSDNIDLEESFEELLPDLKDLEKVKEKIKSLKYKLENSNLLFYEKIIILLFPKYFEKIKNDLFGRLSQLLPYKTLALLQNNSKNLPIKCWDDIGWIRLHEYLYLLNGFYEIEKLKQKLFNKKPRLVIERKIRELEKDFYEMSKRYLKGIYVDKMIKKGEYIGDVNSFFYLIDSLRPGIDRIDSFLFIRVLGLLKIWSSTLKSIRRTFPLSPGIFDYVIFDEASQVDLPSAAPALYRAKNAIIVGDPMQLTHIAGITRDIDNEIAKDSGLSESRDIYPSRIRYCDVSLYKSAENSLNHKPIMLVNHYRSEDQIIDLCNQVFYEDRLKIMTSLDYSKYPDSLPIGVHWINCEGEVLKHTLGSRVNQEEVLLVVKVFEEVINKIAGTNLSVGIVTPYSRQQDMIYESVLKSVPAQVIEKHRVRILTAHKFQGSEKDIMIFSLVLSSRGNGNSDRWYNIYPQILNVALSRAKYLLYIIGDKKFCYKKHGILKRIVKTYDKIKQREKDEEYSIFEKFDSPIERLLYQELKNIDFDSLGYKLIPKLVVKRYTLDFSLRGKKKIDIECDGCQHEIIGGFPVIEDVERDDFLQKEGWQILRYPNHKILSQTNAVIEDILKNL